MIHVTCRLTAKNRDQLLTLRSVIEYGLPLPLFFTICPLAYLKNHMFYYDCDCCLLPLVITLPKPTQIVL